MLPGVGEEGVKESLVELEEDGQAGEKKQYEPETHSKITDVFFDWEDFCDAIDAIPAGAAPGPDGIPAIMMKKAKVPISRLLVFLFRVSLDQGDIPECLKEAFIIPVHKGGSRVEAEKYRPISLTSHIMKTGERVVRKSLVNFLEYTKQLDPKQHGSRSRRSTLSQLLVHQDEILLALENGENIDAIYLDFLKAFDKMDFGILLHKARGLGITGKLGRFVHNFLSGRKQQVLVKGKKSQVSILKSGVPQGSVLGPLLFLIFIGDLSEGVACSTLVYVDDAKTKYIINNEEDVQKHQEELEKIYTWQTNNNMKFNTSKFQVLRYGRNTDLKENTMYFTREMETVIEEVENCRDLGVIMENTGSFNMQNEKACKKARQKCGWILRTFYSRNPKFMRKMFNELSQPHLDYCSQLWAPAVEGKQMSDLEGVLRHFTKQIPAARNMNYWDRLKFMNMNSEQRRMERYRILYVWKVLQGLVPNPGIKELTANENRGRRCIVPFTRDKKRLESFNIIGPKLFNTLPKELRNMKCLLEDFKISLDTFLMCVPDEPPCPGLVPGATDMILSKPSNSLLHQVQRAWREGLLSEWRDQIKI